MFSDRYYLSHKKEKPVSLDSKTNGNAIAADQAASKKPNGKGAKLATPPTPSIADTNNGDGSGDEVQREYETGHNDDGAEKTTIKKKPVSTSHIAGWKSGDNQAGLIDISGYHRSHLWKLWSY